MNKINKKNIINIIIAIIYSGLTFYVMLNHEPWRDEAQAWLIARDLSFIDMVKQMRFEGHPCLWHILLMPFAKIGMPYITLNILSWIIMVITALIVIFKSPFKLPIKICILLSAPFIYFYVSISRVYTLIAFLIIWLASVYNKRREKPCLYGFILLLLANTHIVMSGMVGILIVEFYICDIFKMIKNKTLKENKKILIGFFISIFGVILLILLLSGVFLTNKEVVINTSNYLDSLIEYIKLILVAYIGTSNQIKLFAFSLFVCVICISQVYLYKYQKKFITFFYSSLIVQIAVFVLVYQYRNSTTFFTTYFIMLFCAWITHYEQNEITKKSKISNLFIDMLLIVISLISLVGNFQNINKDIKGNYSASYEMAQFINNNIDEKSIIVATTDYTTSSIIPYCKNYNFYNPQRMEYFTFVTWDSKRKENLNYDKLKEIIKTLSKSNNVYILSSVIDLEYMVTNDEIEKIYHTKNSIVRDESFYLYKVKF